MSTHLSKNSVDAAFSPFSGEDCRFEKEVKQDPLGQPCRSWLSFLGNPRGVIGPLVTTTSNKSFSVASLLPATTEIVAALGAADCLVGRSHECDWPPAIAGLPPLTTPKLDASLPSGEIDQQVQAAAGGALFELDETLLASLAPDLILTQAACKVCAR